MKRGIFFLIRTALIILVIGILVACLLPIRSNAVTRIALSPLEKRLQKKIEFSDSRIWLPANVFLEDVTITDKGGSLT